MANYEYSQKIKISDELSPIIENLKHSPRPLTNMEIHLKIQQLKSQRNIYRELLSLVKYGTIKKVRFEVEGYKFVK